jgi:hypothetical protein
MNIICLGGRIVGPVIAWDLVTTFLAADFSQEGRHLRRLSKVAALENKTTSGIGDKAEVVPAQTTAKRTFHFMPGRQS